MQLSNYELLLYPADSPGSPKRLTAITVNYNSMQIPDAIIRVAVGAPIAASGTKADNALPADWLDPLRKLRVAVRKRHVSSRTAKETVEESVIFEGYANAPSIHLGARNGEITIPLQHWLRDLAAGSMLHEYAYPTEAGMRMETMYRTPDDSGSPAGYSSLSSVLGLPIGWENDLGIDVWSKGLKPILSLLATKEVFGQLEGYVNCAGQVNAVSPLAAEALQRIQGPSTLLGRAYTDGVPLEVRGEANDSGRTLEEAIVSLMSDISIEAFQGSTFWDHLLRFCSDLFIDVVPRPLDALLVPMIPTPGELYSSQILEDALNSINWAETKQLAVRGIIVLAPEPNTTGFDGSQNLATDVVNMPAGCYVASTDPRQGRIFPVDAPVWLASLVTYSDTAGDVPKSRQEGPGNEEAPPPASSPNVFSIGTLFDSYAKTRYVEEALRYRRAVVATKLRFDICVGSTIAVSVRTDAIAQTVGSDTTTLVGRVVATTHTIDRSTMQAVSHFSLSYVQTLQEFRRREFVVDEHPLFSTKFLGGKLVG